LKTERYAGISEFVSRGARKSLVELCIDALDKKQEEQEARLGARGRPAGAALELARRMKVTKRTVNRWLQDEFQSDNINVKILISAAYEIVPFPSIEKVLKDDYKRHAQELAQLGIFVEERG